MSSSNSFNVKLCRIVKLNVEIYTVCSCGYNTNLTTTIEDAVIDTMTTLPALEMQYVFVCMMTSTLLSYVWSFIFKTGSYFSTRDKFDLTMRRVVGLMLGTHLPIFSTHLPL